MIARIGLIVLIVLLVYLGIILVVHAFPSFFSNRTKDAMRDFGKNTYIPLSGRRSMWGFFAVLFFAPSLVPAIAEKEQRRILKKKLAMLKQRVKGLHPDNLKQLPSIAVKFTDLADGWERQVDEQEFDFLPMCYKIERLAHNIWETGKLYPVADELLDECFNLLALAGQAAKSDADIAVNPLSSASEHATIDWAADTAEEALVMMKELLFAVAAVLDQTAPIGDLSQSELDTLKTNIQTARESVATQYTSLINQKQLAKDALNSYDTYLIAFNKATSNLENTKKKATTKISRFRLWTTFCGFDFIGIYG